MSSLETSWKSDRELDVDRVRQLIEEQEPPGADPEDVRFVASGWENDVYASGELYLRFPRRDEVIEANQCEARLLEALYPVFPIDLPNYVFEGIPSETFPYPWYAYEPVRGVGWNRVSYDEGQREDLARDLAEAIASLHSMEVRRAFELGLEDNRETPAIWLDGLRAQEKTLRRVLPEPVAKRWSAFMSGAYRVPGCPDHVRVIHNDLAGPHIRVHAETKRLLGFIDFGEATIGDPTIDFVGIYVEQGAEMTREVVARYPLELPEDWQLRIAFYGRVLALRNVAQAARFGGEKLTRAIEWFIDDFEPHAELPY